MSISTPNSSSTPSFMVGESMSLILYSQCHRQFPNLAILQELFVGLLDVDDTLVLPVVEYPGGQTGVVASSDSAAATLHDVWSSPFSN